MVEQHNYTEINRDWIRFNVVMPGADWRSYKFTKAREEEVTDVADKLLMESWAAERNIIISDTNLNTGRRQSLINKLEDLGYNVEVKVFDVTFKEAVKRDNYRLNGVGQDIIYKQLQQFNDMSMRKTYDFQNAQDRHLPACIIVDVDGTIAEMHDRGPFEWKKVGQDKPRNVIMQMVRAYKRMGYDIIICSGRSDECYHETEKWLDKHLGYDYYDDIHMRKAGDFRKDDAVKEEIFWNHIAHQYSVYAAIDDRPQMIRLWHELKIPNVIAVADPYIEF
jgi:predicted kinase